MDKKKIPKIFFDKDFLCVLNLFFNYAYFSIFLIMLLLVVIGTFSPVNNFIIICFLLFSLVFNLRYWWSG